VKGNGVPPIKERASDEDTRARIGPTKRHTDKTGAFFRIQVFRVAVRVLVWFQTQVVMRKERRNFACLGHGESVQGLSGSGDGAHLCFRVRCEKRD
jgi:hypothetical protein